MIMRKPVAALLLASMAAAAFAQAPADTRRSGFDDMSPALQAIQMDDFANPAALWLAEGEAQWNTRTGSAGKSCADCHGTPATMRGVAARFPAFDTTLANVIDLDAKIDDCRTRRQGAASPPHESRARVALEAFVAHQSRGMPITSAAEPHLDASVAAGARIFRQRMGQIDLSCAQCHDERAGRHLAGTAIPQGHPTGYPVYRSEWQAVGTLQRRLRNCLSGVRAQPYAFGSPEMIALEAFLMRRAAGMKLETPGVRP
ncbi:MAG: sulfur oxidation c-type cytochrome SoxA [Alphaproteobacteria bacterium]|nr:sulfur oxidation c-type cytochrome SoxA [Alphaproteobacteria bacterium]